MQVGCTYLLTASNTPGFLREQYHVRYRRAQELAAPAGFRIKNVCISVPPISIGM